jgi:cystathionine beta-lyase
MEKNWKTKLQHSEVNVRQGFRSLVTPVYRGSTVLFDSAGVMRDNWRHQDEGYSYGLYGTPTTLELAQRICELEKGYRTILTSGGQSAISLINLALLKPADHVLIPESIYGPNRLLADKLLSRFGISVEYYDPLIGEQISRKINDRTQLIWCESPGSVTMEVQDIPAIIRAAHAKNIKVVLDNTWSAGVFFDAFGHQVDITMQALTKYVGGHSDLLLGSVTTRDSEIFERLGEAQQVLGLAVSPDDCSLALRGMQTLAVRLDAIEKSALGIAEWLAANPEIDIVLHPAFPSCPGHDLWKRDFAGSSGVFSVVFKRHWTKPQVLAFADALDLFKIGYSWGGVTSLVMPYDLTFRIGRPHYEHRLVRLNIGLEVADELIGDLSQAMKRAM